MDMSALLMIIRPTYIVCSTGIYCMARIDNFSSKKVKINIYESESGPVLLVP